jgi:hypothetical protein
MVRDSEDDDTWSVVDDASVVGDAFVCDDEEWPSEASFCDDAPGTTGPLSDTYLAYRRAVECYEEERATRRGRPGDGASRNSGCTRRRRHTRRSVVTTSSCDVSLRQLMQDTLGWTDL